MKIDFRSEAARAGADRRCAIAVRCGLAAAFLTLFAILTLLSIKPASAGMTDGVQYTRLPNGLQVLVLENHKAPVAAFTVIYKVGSRNEQFGKTGISHLCEHLMFRGTKKYGPEEFSNIIQENGGDDNAFTTQDFTQYFETINRDGLGVAIKLEADRMANFAPQGFDSEKHVVMEERRMRTEDNPEDALAEIVQANAYVEHPYHWPVIGWMHDIEGLSESDALGYHAIYYSPQNAIVVAVGDFKTATVLSEIREAFGGIKNVGHPLPVTEVEPSQDGERRVTLRHAANVPAVEIAYHVPNYQNAHDAFALEVASEVLGDGKSSRLYKDLVIDKQMVVSVEPDYEMTSFDPTLFQVSAQMRPGVKADDVLAEIDRQVGAMRDHPVTDMELNKAKNQEQAAFVYGQDSVFNQAMELGLYQMLGNYRMLDQYIPQIEAVSAADVQRVMSKYIIDSNRTVGVLVPTGLLPHELGGGGMGGTVHYQMEGLPVQMKGLSGDWSMR